MVRRYSILLLTTLIVFAVFAPTLINAQSFPPPIVPKECAGPDAATKCQLCSLVQLARNLLNVAIFLAIVMSAVLFSWAGIRYLTAMGSESTAGKARQTLLNVFLGLLLILCAWLAVNTLMAIMVDGNVWPWNSICR